MNPKMHDVLNGEGNFRHRVEDVVERRIRPALMAHGGNIEVREAERGDVRVAFIGACASCPSAQITLEQTVEQVLAEELGGELNSVTLVHEADPELLEFARKILSK